MYDLRRNSTRTNQKQYDISIQKSDENNSINYRGLAMLNRILKLLTKIISGRLETWAETQVG